MERILTANVCKITYMDTIGYRIKKYRKTLNLTQKEIATKLGIAASAVTQWENDQTEPNGTNLVSLASIFNISPEMLLGSYSVQEPRASYVVDQSKINLRRVPIISSVQAGSWSEAVETFQPENNESWQETTADVGSKSFALRVQGKSMQNPLGFPSIPHGSIIIVDPEADAINGNIIVAKLPDVNEAIIKKLVIDGNNYYLESLNPDYKTITIDRETDIIGVVKQVIQDI